MKNLEQDLKDTFNEVTQNKSPAASFEDVWLKYTHEMSNIRPSETSRATRRGETKQRTVRWHKRIQQMKGFGAAIAAVCVVVAITAWVLQHASHYPTMGSHPTGQFTIAVNPNSVTSTPLDTSSFRSTLQSYLERRPLPITSSSTTVSTGSTQAPASPPAVNQISDLAVRWSQVADHKYGFAFVTYLANGRPGIADVLALKNGADKWTVTQLDNTPPTISASAISKRFPVYTIESGGGAGFDTSQPTHVNYDFVAGVIVNPSITRIQVIPTDGIGRNVPIVNGVFGYVEFSSNGNPIPNGSPTIKAYDTKGHLIYKR